MWDDEHAEFADIFNQSISQETACIEVPAEKDEVEYKYEFEGIPIKFPKPAYPCQKQMMEKIILGVTKKQNCLLESPTGSGKTAAILCSLLGWLKYVEDQMKAESVEDAQTSYPSPLKKTKLEEDGLKTPTKMETSSLKEAQIDSSKSKLMSSGTKVPVIYYATRTHSQVQGIINQLKETHYSNTPMTILASRSQTCINPIALESSSVDDACKNFRDACYLNSKEGKNYPTCHYYSPNYNPNSQSFGGYDQISNEMNKDKANQSLIWDIEEIKSYGRNNDICPFYGTRMFQQGAKIIFCPYNYLLQSQIRKASGIDIKDNIIVFDESHNIEQVCRDIGSSILSLDKINTKVRHELAQAQLGQPNNISEPIPIPMEKIEPLKKLEVAFTLLSNWLDIQAKSDDSKLMEIGYELVDPTISFKKYMRNLQESEGGVVQLFESLHFGPAHVEELREAYSILNNESEIDIDIQPQCSDERKEPFKLEKEAMDKMSKFLNTLKYLYKKYKNSQNEDYPNLVHYKVMIVLTRDEKRFQNVSKTLPGLVSVSKHDEKPITQIELHVLCMNPSLIFSEMKKARTVIVTSGTLSPTTSFASELGLNFQQELIAQHVVGPDRIFTGVITKYGNNTKDLEFTKASFDRHFDDYQSDLSKIILDCCHQVKYGVLVFFTSKQTVKNLQSIWERNGFYQELKQLKDIFYETDAQNTVQVNEIVKAYLEKVKYEKGAILFAVIRGRVSEGVDFKDNQARLVITVGIPYLPLKDVAVICKRRYNTEMINQQNQNNGTSSQDQGRLLSGGEWYEACAFRALNQAFGRCIRHANDWGIVLMVERRLSYTMSKEKLSRWVQNGLEITTRKTYGSMELVMPDVKIFLDRLQNQNKNPD